MKLPQSITKTTLSIGVGLTAFAVLALPVAPVSAVSSTATTTINGNIGSAISITSSGSVAMNVVPTPAGALSSAKDTVTVDTNNATGYKLTLEMSNATNGTNLVNGADTIAAHSGTVGTPSALSNNTWGFRVDGLGGFGSGTTSAETNIASSAYTWAGVSANGAPTQIKTTSVAATADKTDVWYAMKADTTKAVGTYTNTVLYTAVTN